MQTELVSPNLHVVLIHYPLAMLVIGTLIELFAFLWPRSGFRAAGRWMILIGALSTVPAAFSGIYALRDVARVLEDQPGVNGWFDLKTASPVLHQPEIWEMMRRHLLYESLGGGIAVLVVILWLGASDNARKTLHLTLLLVLTACVGAMISGAWFGGEAIYRKGVAVEPVFPRPVVEPATLPADWTKTPTRIEILFPPVEQHTIFAGVTTAIALLAVGLSFRKLNTAGQLADDPILTAGPVANRKTPRVPPSSVEMVRTLNPALEVELKQSVPAGRFWLVAFLLAVVTALGGVFVLARGADLLEQIRQTPKQIPQLLWQQIKPDAPHRINRLLAHAAAGSVIVSMPIILALLARFAPRQRLILSIATLVLVLALAAQVWLGILLLFDGSDGPVYHVNPRTVGVPGS